MTDLTNKQRLSLILKALLICAIMWSFGAILRHQARRAEPTVPVIEEEYEIRPCPYYYMNRGYLTREKE